MGERTVFVPDLNVGDAGKFVMSVLSDISLIFSNKIL